MCANMGAGSLPSAKVDITSSASIEVDTAPSDSAGAQLDTDTAGAMSGPLANARQFILAGKAIFTLVGINARYTFKVQRKEASDRYAETYFVQLLTGPENTTDYTYLGILDSQAGAVRLTRNSTFKDDSAPVVAIRWALARIWADKPLPAPAQILHAGRCGRCGRLLTVPSSIASGFGPECIGRI